MPLDRAVPAGLIVNELVTNAFKYAFEDRQEGLIQVIFTTDSHTGEACVVVEDNGTISVLDRGPGIGEHERQFIFRRFWRRDRRKQGSTGLGLSIVQRIAELNSAVVTVENRDPHGARFTLKFVPLRLA